MGRQKSVKCGVKAAAQEQVPRLVRWKQMPVPNETNNSDRGGCGSGSPDGSSCCGPQVLEERSPAELQQHGVPDADHGACQEGLCQEDAS